MPYGRHAAAALAEWLGPSGRPHLRTGTVGAARRRRGGVLEPTRRTAVSARRRGPSSRSTATASASATSCRRTCCATRARPICSITVLTCASCRSCSAMRRSRRRRSTRKVSQERMFDVYRSAHPRAPRSMSSVAIWRGDSSASLSRREPDVADDGVGGLAASSTASATCGIGCRWPTAVIRSTVARRFESHRASGRARRWRLRCCTTSASSTAASERSAASSRLSSVRERNGSADITITSRSAPTCSRAAGSSPVTVELVRGGGSAAAAQALRAADDI